jgi:cyanuric acid amidohydrolase
MPLRILLSHPRSPTDLAVVRQLLATQDVADIRTFAVFGKTEGAADLLETSRHQAQAETAAIIREYGGEALLHRSWSIFSTGCEGITTPVCVAVADVGPPSLSSMQGLVVGAARSAPLADTQRCTLAHVRVAAECVRTAMENVSLSASEVRLVLVKSPIRRSKEGPEGRHASSTAASRGAAALGAGGALGEIDLSTLPPDPVLSVSAFASRTMAFSGTETECVEAIVLGSRAGGDANWLITQAVQTDFLDVEALSKLECPHGFEPFLVFYKAGIAADGMLRGLRTTIHSSELPPDKQMRAAASGLIGAIFGRVDTFISGGAEHQGADGACLASVLWRRVSASSIAKTAVG